MFLYVMIFICFGAYSCLNSKPQYFYVSWGLQLLSQQTSMYFEAYSCLASKPQYLPWTWVRVVIYVLQYMFRYSLMFMFYVICVSRFSLLGIRLTPFSFSVMQETRYGGGRILGGFTCVLRINGMNGLRVNRG